MRTIESSRTFRKINRDMKAIKNLILVAAVIAGSLSQSQAQVIVDGVNINELEEVQVVQLVALGNLFSRKILITIDYGQFIKWGSNRGSVVTDRKGDIKKFNSNMDAINYLENNGWTLIDVNSTGNPNSTPVTSYFFRRQE